MPEETWLDRHWPLLAAGFCACLLWYYQGGSEIAGAAGFGGLGWLAWERLIKPRL